PRIIGPQDPTRSTNSRPSASCSMAPEAEVMNGGVPPTLPKARTGEFTPEGVTCWARVNRSDEAEWVMGGLLRIGGSSDGGREGAGNRARDGGREGAGNRARDGAGDWPRDEVRTVLRGTRADDRAGRPRTSRRPRSRSRSARSMRRPAGRRATTRGPPDRGRPSRWQRPPRPSHTRRRPDRRRRESATPPPPPAAHRGRADRA